MLIVVELSIAPLSLQLCRQEGSRFREAYASMEA
jgi:hypothetical protein